MWYQHRNRQKKWDGVELSETKPNWKYKTSGFEQQLEMNGPGNKWSLFIVIIKK